MKFRTLMVLKAFVCLVFGVLFLAVPAQAMSLFGVTLDAGGVFALRLYGAALAGNLLLSWFARDAEPSQALRAIVLAGFVYDAIGLVVALAAVLTGVMNAMGWLAVLIYLVLALGFGYFQFIKPIKD